MPVSDGLVIRDALIFCSLSIAMLAPNNTAITIAPATWPASVASLFLDPTKTPTAGADSSKLKPKSCNTPLAAVSNSFSVLVSNFLVWSCLFAKVSLLKTKASGGIVSIQLVSKKESIDKKTIGFLNILFIRT